MSGDLTARDVIAREFRAWDFDAVTPTTQADVVLAALAAAGWELHRAGEVVPTSDVQAVIARVEARGTYPAAMRELRALIQQGGPT